jgi:endonuclease/exonuclease/phosphatase family metal-dependent hydrolase
VSDVRVRVLAYNIRHGQGVGGILSNARIARVVAASGCDVAALSEVWRVGTRYDQPSALAGRTGMASTFHSLHSTFGREAGNLVLSRWQPTATRHIDLGGRREERGLLITDIESKEASFTFAATHLSLHASTRASQIALLAEELPRDRPVILAGDFNCHVAELDSLGHILRFPADVPATFPSPMPFRALDHIGFSEHWRLESLTAPASWASDHRPLIAEFVLADATASTMLSPIPKAHSDTERR